MKRRRFFETLAVAPAATLVVSQQTASAQGPAGRGAMEPTVPLETSVSDEAATTSTGFFAPEQLAALRKLGDVIMPALNGKPGASDAEAAEFLDFLISKSPESRQLLYGNGLNALNAASWQRYQKPFGELSTAQAAPLLEPLQQPWTFYPPNDPLAHFLREAKSDIRTATVNSKAYVAASASEGRRFSGMGSYMLPLD